MLKWILSFFISTEKRKDRPYDPVTHKSYTMYLIGTDSPQDQMLLAD